MLVLDRLTGEWRHGLFADLPRFVRPGDLVVINDTRVFPARLLGTWEDTGGKVEFLLLAPRGEPEGEGQCWSALCGSGRRVRVGLRAICGDGALQIEVLAVPTPGEVEVRLSGAAGLDPDELIARYGRMPLPPYIARDRVGEATHNNDRHRYQTVYARHTGAVAAPTAGLHFTDAMFAQLKGKGLDVATVTLHVGPGTFRPVQSDRVEEHRMHDEWYEVPPATASAIADCKGRGGRVLAVGSTSVRTLETAATRRSDGTVVPCSGYSRLFIRPPYRFRVVDTMLTNFHLPRSTLLMMVAALAGREKVLAAYREAIRMEYRFYSYGDCMLIL